jgi:Protein of unknown function (DUF2589)
MAMLASLEDVVRAIAGSIMKAQYLVEKAQVANLATFFDRQHQPKALDLRLPSIHSTADTDEYYIYRLPLISLVQHSALIIQEAEIELDVELGAIDEGESDAGNDDHMRSDGMLQKTASLRVNPETGGLAKKSGNAAHIKLKLVSSEKSEGLSRLLNDVVKSQGYAPVAPLSADDDPEDSANEP